MLPRTTGATAHWNAAQIVLPVPAGLKCRCLLCQPLPERPRLREAVEAADIPALLFALQMQQMYQRPCPRPSGRRESVPALLLLVAALPRCPGGHDHWAADALQYICLSRGKCRDQGLFSALDLPHYH